jgi:DNA-binding LacI/PurR family transcriptional regulator
VLYCLQQRRQRIGCLMGPAAATAYFLAQARQVGLDAREPWCCWRETYGGDYERNGFELMQELWQHPEHPQALLVFDDIACKGAVQAMLQLGIAVPRQLLVVTLANQGSGVFYPLPLARLEYDTEEVARTAGELLLEQLTEPQLPIRQVLVRPTLVPLPTATTETDCAR